MSAVFGIFIFCISPVSYHLGEQLVTTEPINTLEQLNTHVEFESNPHKSIIIFFRYVLLSFLLLLLLLEDFVVERVIRSQLVLVLLDCLGLFTDLRNVLVDVYMEGDPVVLVKL